MLERSFMAKFMGFQIHMYNYQNKGQIEYKEEEKGVPT